jgi:hypothetical protein
MKDNTALDLLVHKVPCKVNGLEDPVETNVSPTIGEVVLLISFWDMEENIDFKCGNAELSDVGCNGEP